MSRFRSLLPWLVTLVALSIAATSVAPAVAAALTGAQKAQVKKIAAKQAKKAIKKSARTLTVAQAGHATTATTATTAATAQIALSPVAYAVVDENGVLVSSRGLAQADVVQRDVAGYCFDTPFEFKTVQTTPVHTGSNSTVSAKVGIRGVLGVVQECQAEEEVEVATTVNGGFAKAPFIIWFYN